MTRVNLRVNLKSGLFPAITAMFSVMLLAACAGMMREPPVNYEAIISATDRSDADRKNDIRRKAPQLLAFTGVRPGMKVLDMATGGGYSTELMARVVGPTGVVYGQDAPNASPGGIKNYASRANTCLL